MIQSVNRALNILEFLSRTPGTPRTPSEIAKATGLNTATASNIIKTLAERNYLEQEGPRKGYVPGIMCNTLASEEAFEKKIVKAASQHMEDLARATGETVLIAVLKKNKRFILHQVEGVETLQVRRGVISDAKVYDTATGKTLLAALPKSELEDFIRGQGLTGAAGKKLKAELEEGARGGFVLHETHNRQVAGIAYPVRKEAMTVAALGLYLPSFRFKGGHREKIMRGLESAAGIISKNLHGGRKWT